MSKKSPKFEALVVNAIRRLQAAQGSTANEIANFLNQEYDVSGPDLKRQIQLTIRRGVNYGILQKSKRGYVTCERNIPDSLDPLDGCLDCKLKMTVAKRGRSSKRSKVSSRRKHKSRSRKSKSKRAHKRGRSSRKRKSKTRRSSGMRSSGMRSSRMRRSSKMRRTSRMRRRQGAKKLILVKKLKRNIRRKKESEPSPQASRTNNPVPIRERSASRSPHRDEEHQEA